MMNPIKNFTFQRIPTGTQEIMKIISKTFNEMKKRIIISIIIVILLVLSIFLLFFKKEKTGFKPECLLILFFNFHSNTELIGCFE